MHINRINNKKYIGITCKIKPEYRWVNGGEIYSGSSYFWHALEIHRRLKVLPIEITGKKKRVNYIWDIDKFLSQNVGI